MSRSNKLLAIAVLRYVVIEVNAGGGRATLWAAAETTATFFGVVTTRPVSLRVANRHDYIDAALYLAKSLSFLCLVQAAPLEIAAIVAILSRSDPNIGLLLCLVLSCLSCNNGWINRMYTTIPLCVAYGALEVLVPERRPSHTALSCAVFMMWFFALIPNIGFGVPLDSVVGAWGNAPIGGTMFDVRSDAFLDVLAAFTLFAAVPLLTKYEHAVEDELAMTLGAIAASLLQDAEPWSVASLMTCAWVCGTLRVTNKARMMVRALLVVGIAYHAAPLASRPDAEQPLPKTLFVVMGQLRGGVQARESFFKNLVDLVPNADVALSAPLGDRTSSRDGWIRRAKYVWNRPDPPNNDYGYYLSAISDEKTWREAYCYKFHPLRIFRLAHFFGGVSQCGMASGGAVQLMNRYSVLGFLKEEFGDVIPYDVIMITRADFLIACPVDVRRLLTFNDDSTVRVQRGQSWGGISDRIAVFPAAQAPAALGALTDILDRPDHWTTYLANNQNFDKNIEFTLHHYYADVLNWTIDAMPYPAFTIHEKKDFSLHGTGVNSNALVEFDVRIKYSGEFAETRQVCGREHRPFMNHLRTLMRSNRASALSDYVDNLPTNGYTQEYAPPQYK